MRYVIIGASAAGCRAAETLRRYDPQGTITIISEEARPLYSRPLLTYLLSREVQPAGVWLEGEDYFRGWGLTPVLGEPVTGVEPGAHAVRLASGRAIAYDKLLIASGARPRLPGIPGEDLAGVFTLRTLADWQRLEAGLTKARAVAVVGAGAVGLKAAEALNRRGLKVTLVELAAQALPQILDAAAAALLHQALGDLGVELKMHTAPAAVLGSAGQVKALALADGGELAADAVLFATGVTPNLDFLAGTDLLGPEGLVVNAWMQSAHPDIFAAGDCVRAPHFLTGAPAYYPIWPAAAAQGRVAGANLAGANLRYGGLLPQNSLSLPGLKIITGGLGPQDAADCEVVAQLDERRGQYRRLVFREGRLVGLTFVGAVADAGIYFQLMEQQLPIVRLPADPRSRAFQPGGLWG